MRLIIKKTLKSRLTIGIAGLLVGALIILGIRFISYKNEAVHYHSNFAIYINGQREQFKNAVYYTDIEESCAIEEEMTPHERAHMHGQVNSVVHVEDNAVTWGQFFQNIGWVVDSRLIQTPQQLYLPDANNKITFMLNGETTDNIVTRVIKDQDRLLVDYGNSSSQTLLKDYQTVPATAHYYDVTPDPASCSGHKPTTMRDRFTHMF